MESYGTGRIPLLVLLAMDPLLAADAEGFSESEEVEANWSQADQDPFGPEWISAREHLESTPLDILMAEVSLGDFVPPELMTTQAAIAGTLQQHGFVGQRLLAQRGEEKGLLAQVLAELGMELDMKQQEGHRRQLVQRTLELEYAEPFAKRLRGEARSASLSYISDASCSIGLPNSSGYTTGSTATGAPLGSPQDDWMIPMPGKGPRYKGSVTGMTREELGRQALRFWSSRIFAVLSYERQHHGSLWYLVSCMLLEIAKLHEAGGCAWTTVKLADCQEIDKPLGSRYNSRCKLCWPELIKTGESDIMYSSSDSDL